MTDEVLDNENKNHRRVTALVLTVLLFLRIPYIFAITYFRSVEDQSGGAIYEVGTYLLIGALIWWERKQLADFHIDTIALIFILLFRPLQTLILKYWGVTSPLAFPNPASWIIWATSLGLVLALWRSGFKPTRIKSSNLIWICIGLLAGLTVSVCENLNPFISALNTSHIRSVQFASTLASTSMIFFYHLGFAPINEEPLFRGFLWEFLRQAKWKEVWIWLFQAALFTLAHLYFAKQYPLLFWVYIPVAALLLGLIAWRSRSIAGGMVAHAMINASTYVLALSLLLILLRIFQ